MCSGQVLQENLTTTPPTPLYQLSLGIKWGGGSIYEYEYSVFTL